MSRIQPAMDAQEKKWQREGDARTLADAAAINADKPRLKEARKAAKTMAPEAVKEAKNANARASAMKRIAKAK